MSDNNIMVDRMSYDGMLYYDSDEFTQTGRATALLNRGKAISLTAEKQTFVVAILGATGFTVPGIECQKLILIDDAGKILDELSCGINTRYGSLTTAYPKRDDDDGAQLVIQFVPTPDDKSKWHNWHTITHEGKPYTFRANEPIDWVNRGLVRLAIRDGKFRVLFPELIKPDARAVDK